MHEYGLCIEPEYPDEAFEVLVDSVGTAVFTRNEAIEIIANILDVDHYDAGMRFDKLLTNDNIRLIS